MRPTHWLRTNRASRVPRRVVCIDSEAYRERSGSTETQTFRLAVASFDLLDELGVPTRPARYIETMSTDELWSWITSCTATSHRTVVFAHKLDYDLRLTDGLRHLPTLGFACKGVGLNPHSIWARFSDGKRSLWLVDSLTFLPAPLDRLAQLLKRERHKLPADDAPTERWLERCRDDVETLRAALLHLIGALKAEDLGDFRLTGSAQASAAFRHRFLEPRTLLVHSDPVALEAERRAAFAGRCEVWRHGRIRGPIYEYDFSASYARIAEACEVPTRLWGEHTVLPPHRLAKVRGHQAVLADVVARTETPTVPAPFEGRIVWPVGEFRTTLWDCELDLLEAEGGEYEIERLWLYDRAPILQPWARWILAALEGSPPGDDPFLRLLLKHWSRALIGRFGLRYAVVEHVGFDPDFDLSLYPVADTVAGRDTTYLKIGRQVLEQTGQRESDSSTPMVMSWVMARARYELWKLARACDLEHILYLDTDGLLVDAEGAAQIEAALATGYVEGVRRKAEWKSVELRSPRNVDVGDERRISGLPRKAARVRAGEYQGEVWESLPAAMRRRRADRLVISERTFSVSDADPRRTHLAGGRTAPIRLTLEAMQAEVTAAPAALSA